MKFTFTLFQFFSQTCLLFQAQYRVLLAHIHKIIKVELTLKQIPTQNLNFRRQVRQKAHGSATKTRKDEEDVHLISLN